MSSVTPPNEYGWEKSGREIEEEGREERGIYSQKEGCVCVCVCVCV